MVDLANVPQDHKGPQGGVPLYRNPGKLPICREDWNGKVAGREEFPKDSVELKLHAGSLRHVVPERVENGPIVRAYIKSDEMPCTIVPRPTTSGDGCVSGSPGWGRVLGAGPLGGDISKT